MTTCSRSGCTKQLRSDNSRGVCSSNCESPDAPPNKQAAGVKRAPTSTSAKKVEELPHLPPAKETRSHVETIALFRDVAQAVGRDPDEMIAEFAQAWLDGLREKLQ